MKHNPLLMDLASTDSDIYNVLLWIYQCAWERAKAALPRHYLAVELGVRCGDSTIALLSALDQARNGTLYSCDIEPCNHARALVARHGSKRWRFTQTDSLAFASHFEPKSCNLIFLDTSHEYGQTVRELDVWSNKLALGGRMLIHDTCSRPAVARAIAEFLQTRPHWPYYNIDTYCGLGVLDRPSTPDPAAP